MSASTECQSESGYMEGAAFGDGVATVLSIVDTRLKGRYGMPDDVVQRVKRLLEYTVPGGKLFRGRMVLMAGASPEAVRLGWCVEILQASFLIADDIMDRSSLRRGKPCWYTLDNVGMDAVNDSLILQSVLFLLLEDTASSKEWYGRAIHLFQEVIFQTELGQMMDLMAQPQGSKGPDVLNNYTMTRLESIYEYKTAYYTFFLPISLSLMLRGIDSSASIDTVKEVAIRLGKLFQIQDDFLDCFGDSSITGKVGTDIQDAKCTWLLVQALERCSPSQRNVLQNHIGNDDPASVDLVRSLYRDLGLEAAFHACERQLVAEVEQLLTVEERAEVREGLRGVLHMIAYRKNHSENAIPFDVLVVGAGPAGLATAIRLKQKMPEASVCVLEKGNQPGDHILSGNVFDPIAFNTLFPNWQELGAPLHTKVTEDHFKIMTASRAFTVPTPKWMSNEGNYIISLAMLTRWMAEQAEGLGVEIYSGFAANRPLYTQDGALKGIETNAFGIGKDGSKKDNYQEPMEIHAKHTVLAEGARGSISEELMTQFDLRSFCAPQTYGLGLKEVWEVDELLHVPGFVSHSLGWPLQEKAYGGGFLYHMDPNLVLVGLVAGLDYTSPHLNPYEEFQQFKCHPSIRPLLESGRCISYGARVINEGGYQSIPKVTFPGGSLVGCSAGFVNVPKIKGSHAAIQSGILAADALVSMGLDHVEGKPLQQYADALEESWVMQDLYKVRNVRPAFQYGFIPGMVYAGLSTFVLRGKEPWTLQMPHKDVEATKAAADVAPIEYPKHDGKVTFDILTNVQRTGTYHEEDQPVHLKVKTGMEHVPVQESLAIYDGPEQRFCPAKVYEYVEGEDGSPALQINAQNCIHCKTCDIKTPKNYIKWSVPEGGGGPAYENM